MTTHLFIFGDSITYGAWDPGYGGWASRLRNFLDLEYDHVRAYPLGIGGDTTQTLLSRFKNEIEARHAIKPDKETIVMIAIGINDSRIIKQTGQHEIPRDQFEQNMHKLISIAKQYSETVILVGITKTKGTIESPLEWKGSQQYTNEYIQEYDQIIEEISKEQTCHYIQMFDLLEPQDLLEEDGLHPNSNGHEKCWYV